MVQKVITGGDNNLYEQLSKAIRNSTEMKFIVAFLMESGINLLLEDLEYAFIRGAKITIITGTYMNITQPSAIALLRSKFGEAIKIRFFSDPTISFHPKTYILKSGNNGLVFIGSSNLSSSALKKGVEWNYRLDKQHSTEDFTEFERRFDDVYNNKSFDITYEKYKEYASIWKKPRVQTGRRLSKNFFKINEADEVKPMGAQTEALYELDLARKDGITKGLVVAATGVGKTYLAAFDSKPYKKVLFVAHREEILKQAQESFAKVRGARFGSTILNAKNKETDADVVFASVFTLSKDIYLNSDCYPKDFFDYIVIDEFHHAAAKSYKKTIDYFNPEFLLGLTATPYRMDNKDIFSLCDDNILYEVNLKDSINRELLVPFKYYGIYDETNYSAIEISNGKYNERDLEKNLSTHTRAALILKNYRRFAQKRTVAFCSSIKHAEYMADYFVRNGIKAITVHSSNKYDKLKTERSRALELLESGKVDIIFTVDIFNEGVDIPSLDTVLFLRPTESYVVFLQQLGRGLRLYEDKEYLVVLDFIGNYKRAHYLPYLLAGENPMTINDSTHINPEELEYPDSCKVQFELRLLDVFDEMKKYDPLTVRMKNEYFRVKRFLDRRPLRVDIFESVDIPCKEFLKEGYLKFLADIGELNASEKVILKGFAGKFIREIEKTSMTKSYKIPVLSTFLKGETFNKEVSLHEIGTAFEKFYRQTEYYQKDLQDKRHVDWGKWDHNRFEKEALNNPVKFLAKKNEFFHYDEINKIFSISEDIKPFVNKPFLLKAFIEHYKDILEYRTKNYFQKRFK
ncbi:MAG: DEAD/DEAH box helicase family protein [Alkaliphilus sp.]